MIKAITAATYVKDVILVTHSMGALDSRAYIEGLGSTIAPCIVIQCAIAPGQVPYTGDVAEVITVDGANSGANLAYLALFASSPLNAQELAPNSAVIQALNYSNVYADASGAFIAASDAPAPIVALVSYFRDQVNSLCVNSFSFSCGSDGVVQTDSQSIEQSLANHPIPGTIDLNPSGNTPPGNTYISNDSTITADSHCLMTPLIMLHFLPCLADTHPSADQPPGDILYSAIIPITQGQFSQINVQITDESGQTYSGPISLTLTGPNGLSTSISSGQPPLIGPEVPVSTTQSYALTYNSGGPTGEGTPTITGTDSFGNTCSLCFIQPGNWSLTFDVSFNSGTVSKPTATTQAATNIAGGGATLTSTVNPNGAATKVWFEWGSTSALGNMTPQMSLASGTTAVSVTAPIAGLTVNATYYFRIDASNSAGTSYGSILSFTTATAASARSANATERSNKFKCDTDFQLDIRRNCHLLQDHCRDVCRRFTN